VEAATFEEYSAGGVYLSGGLQSKLIGVFSCDGGRKLLQRLMLCVNASGRQCFIVPATNFSLKFLFPLCNFQPPNLALTGGVFHYAVRPPN
jgi:hypothetical protein